MNEFIQKYAFTLCYLAIVSLVSIIMTIRDKIAAKRDNRRTPEARLLLFSALGGSVAMFITMQLIRHKTKHLKFMIGIPLIMILQGIALYFCIKYGILI